MNFLIRYLSNLKQLQVSNVIALADGGPKYIPNLTARSVIQVCREEEPVYRVSNGRPRPRTDS